MLSRIWAEVIQRESMKKISGENGSALRDKHLVGGKTFEQEIKSLGHQKIIICLCLAIFECNGYLVNNFDGCIYVTIDGKTE